MSDVYLFQTPEDGEIEMADGDLVLTEGLETASYLSLFGGNDEDNGSNLTERKQFWGNMVESDPIRRERSETSTLLDTLPPKASNLNLIARAAERDLAWLESTGRVTELAAACSIPALNLIRLRVSGVVNGIPKTILETTEPWT